MEYFTSLLHHHYYCFHYIIHSYLFWLFVCLVGVWRNTWHASIDIYFAHEHISTCLDSENKSTYLQTLTPTDPNFHINSCDRSASIRFNTLLILNTWQKSQKSRAGNVTWPSATEHTKAQTVCCFQYWIVRDRIFAFPKHSCFPVLMCTCHCKFYYPVE